MNPRPGPLAGTQRRQPARKHTAFRLPESTLKALDEMGAAIDATRTALIIRAVADLYERHTRASRRSV
ncbi:MAG: hypothetical protein WC876_02015 [Candidatus Thermoplasmatota archaeon]